MVSKSFRNDRDRESLDERRVAEWLGGAGARWPDHAQQLGLGTDVWTEQPDRELLHVVRAGRTGAANRAVAVVPGQHQRRQSSRCDSTIGVDGRFGRPRSLMGTTRIARGRR